MPFSSDRAVEAQQPLQPLHTLPTPFTSSPLTILTQGAEALVYRTTFLTPSTPCVLKYRPPKPYRHPTLDKRLTKARLLAEARVLVRSRKEGIKVPAVLGGDWENGWLILEWVEGRTVRRVLDAWVEEAGKRREEKEKGEGGGILGLMGRIGRAVGKLHEIGICHGDLTTSNLMLRPPTPTSSTTSTSTNGTNTEEQPPDSQPQPPGRHTVSTQREAALDAPPPSSRPPPTSDPQPDSTSLDGDIVLIDFGLAAQITRQTQDEDRAVDLYVLERAFAATHPSAEDLFQEVLRSYGESYKGAQTTLKRLADVRLRGRKRSMLG